MNARLKAVEERRKWLLEYSSTQRELLAASGAALRHRLSKENIIGQVLKSRRVAGRIAGLFVARWAAKKLVGWFARRWLVRQTVRSANNVRRHSNDG